MPTTRKHIKCKPNYMVISPIQEMNDCTIMECHIYSAARNPAEFVKLSSIARDVVREWINKLGE